MDAADSTAVSRGTGGRGPSRRRRVRLVGAGATVLLGLGALAVVDVVRAPGAEAAGLVAFGDCGELGAWYRDMAAERVSAYGFGGGLMWASAEAADASIGGAVPVAEADSLAVGSATGGPVGQSGTGTNVQEAGVDEPAAVKTDGTLAYTLAGTRLVVVDLAGQTRVVAEVDLGQGRADVTFTELLLLGDRVLVLGTAWPVMEPVSGGPAVTPLPFPGPTTGTTVAVSVDVTDPAAPRHVDTFEMDGSYVSARATGGTVRLVTTSSPSLALHSPGELAPGEDPADPAAELLGEQQALRLNEEVVASAADEQWLPQRVERAEDGTVSRSPAMDCSQVSRPSSAAGLGTVTVLTLDPSAGPGSMVLDTDAVSADGDLVYASPDRLYVATTAGGWWGGSVEDTRTDLHGFDTTSATSTDYLVSGSVDGWLLGRWALSAQDGYLRVATTSTGAAPGASDAGAGEGDTVSSDAMLLPAPQAAPDTSSSVVVLDEASGTLTEVGRVDGLGPGEQIRSVRWFGDLALVVTFRQTDPLYTVDLSDPAAPVVLGELKVTGYSGYLHPLGDDLVLGVGQEATQEGVGIGAKVESYDVSDLAAPAAVSTLVWEESSSAVEWDSRLFAYLPQLRTAVLPLDRYGQDDWSSGLVAVALDEAGGITGSGSWDLAQGASVVSVASTGDRVLAVSERWDIAAAEAGDGSSSYDVVGVPLRSLTVLDGATLTVQGTAELG